MDVRLGFLLGEQIAYVRRSRVRTCACAVQSESGKWFYRRRRPEKMEPMTSRPLLLLHPTFLHSEIFTPQLDGISKFVDVIAVDLRGHGKSAPPTEGEKYTHAGQLVEFLDALGEKEVDVLGVEMGGAVAMDFAECFPDRVKTMILVNTSAFLYAFGSQSYFDISDAMKNGGVEEACRRWLHRKDFQYTRTQDPVMWFVEQIMSEYKGWHFLRDDQMMWLGNGIDGYDRIDNPTLLILGQYCSEDYNEITSILAKKIRNVTRHVQPETGMLPNLENSKDFNMTILSFLKKMA